MQEIVIYTQFCGRYPLVLTYYKKKVVYSYNFYNLRKNRNIWFLREKNIQKYC